MFNPEKILTELLPKALKKDKKYQPYLGCKPLKQATIDLERIVRASLDTATALTYSFNSNDELIATWKDKEETVSMNVTDILKQSPEYEHITLHISKNSKGKILPDKNGIAIIDEKIFETYIVYVSTQGNFKPKLSSVELKSGEDIALNIYSRKYYYAKINDFLRRDGTNTKIPKKWHWNDTTEKILEGDSLQIRLKDILYASVFAANGLNRRGYKHRVSNFDQKSTLDFCWRREKVTGFEDFFEERIRLFTEISSSKSPSLIREKAFLSTSDFNKNSSFCPKKKFNSFTLIIRDQNAKSIVDVSQFSAEKEVLIPPAEFRCLSYTQILIQVGRYQYELKHFFIMAEHCRIPAAKQIETITQAVVSDSKKIPPTNLFAKSHKMANAKSKENEVKENPHENISLSGDPPQFYEKPIPIIF